MNNQNIPYYPNILPDSTEYFTLPANSLELA